MLNTATITCSNIWCMCVAFTLNAVPISAQKYLLMSIRTADSFDMILAGVHTLCVVTGCLPEKSTVPYQIIREKNYSSNSRKN